MACGSYITNGSTWTTWVTYSSISDSLTSVTVGDTWNDWVTTAGTAATSVTWNTWITDNSSLYVGNNGVAIYKAPELTPEQIEAKQVESERLKRESEERQREWLNSQERARRLLAGFLDRRQKQDLKQKGCFEVKSKSGKQFRLRPGRIPYEVDSKGKEIASYCIHSRHRVPEHDELLMWKLMLEADEDEFYRVANERSLV